MVALRMIDVGVWFTGLIVGLLGMSAAIASAQQCVPAEIQAFKTKVRQ